MRSYCFIVIVFILMVCSCTENYDLNLTANEPRLVVEGLITNERGPYYLQLTKSRNNITYNSYNDSNYNPYSNINGTIPVKDAIIVISDNTGTIDTLIVPPDSVMMYYYDNENVLDSFIMENPDSHCGYYQTSKIQGIVGNTYYLKIIWENKEYHAQSYLPFVPPVDSVNFGYNQGMPGKEDYYIPHIYFNEPQDQKNYYLFDFNVNGGRVWGFSVLDDVLLDKYVNGLDVFKGEAPDWWMTAYPTPGSDYEIRMYSVTRDAYDFYKALINQFKNDGGVYSPAPASAPTNIDNNALGFFRASAVNIIKGKIPDSPLFY